MFLRPIRADFTLAFAQYSTCSKGAPVGKPLYASATRLPVPVMMITSALPLTQPAPFTTSWMIGARFGVRWSTPAAPMVIHDTGDHSTAAVVLALDDMFHAVVAKAGALSLA